MGKKTIEKRIHELATRAIKEIPSPVAYMFTTPNDCGVSREQMQAFLQYTRELHKKNKKPFGYICTTEQTPHGFHYHGIAFVSDRNYGLPIRFGAMLKAQWHEVFPKQSLSGLRMSGFVYVLNSNLSWSEPTTSTRKPITQTWQRTRSATGHHQSSTLGYPKPHSSRKTPVWVSPDLILYAPRQRRFLSSSILVLCCAYFALNRPFQALHTNMHDLYRFSGKSQQGGNQNARIALI